MIWGIAGEKLLSIFAAALEQAGIKTPVGKGAALAKQEGKRFKKRSAMIWINHKKRFTLHTAKKKEFTDAIRGVLIAPAGPGNGEEGLSGHDRGK